MIRHLTNLFPLWAVLLAAIAYAVPAPFAAWQAAITPLLGVVMLGMGLTLTGESFRLVLRRPALVTLGVTLQFALMPLIGWTVARLLDLSPMLAAGVVLVGACPGGTASNVIAFLAGGDVALSITLTSVSTLLSVLATPLLTWAYIGRSVEVSAWPMLLSVLKVVLLPVTAGVLINAWLGVRLVRVRAAFPVVSVGAITLIIAIIVGLTANRLADVGLAVVAAVAIHNASGLAGGYWTARALGYGTIESRTLAIEVGMQNSGLGVALATTHFSAVAALPGAVFSVWHNLSGAALAGWWSRKVQREPGVG